MPYYKTGIGRKNHKTHDWMHGHHQGRIEIILSTPDLDYKKITRRHKLTRKKAYNEEKYSMEKLQNISFGIVQIILNIPTVFFGWASESFITIVFRT